MMLAAPAMPNARASELPMMIIIIAPDTHEQRLRLLHRRGARSRAAGWWMAVTSSADQRGGDQLEELDERLAADAPASAAAAARARSTPRWPLDAAQLERPANPDPDERAAEHGAGERRSEWSATATPPCARPRPTHRSRRPRQAGEPRARGTTAAGAAASAAACRRRAGRWCGRGRSARMPALSITGDAAQIDDEMPVAAAKELLHVTFERLGGPPATSGSIGDRTRRSPTVLLDISGQRLTSGHPRHPRRTAFS